jgi:hypothetical protein
MLARILRTYNKLMVMVFAIGVCKEVCEPKEEKEREWFHDNGRASLLYTTKQGFSLVKLA